MGTCCGKENDKKLPIHSKSTKSILTSAISSPGNKIIVRPIETPKKKLKIYCEDLYIKERLHYIGELPISDIKEQLKRKYPHLDLGRYAFFKKHAQILNYSATIRQLGILPGDKLKLIRIQDSLESSIELERSIRRPRANQNSSHIESVSSQEVTIKDSLLFDRDDKKDSLSHIAEEESTTKKEVLRLSPKQALTLGRMEGNSISRIGRYSNGINLWRTAMPSPTTIRYLTYEALEFSSTTNNTHEQSIREKQLPLGHLCFSLKANGKSVTLDSDESLIDETKLLEKQSYGRTSHPRDFFKDLSGPFFAFKQM